MIKTVLITGGAGFIGSHLADALIKKKYNVVIVDNFSKGKISNLKNIKKKIKLIKCNIGQNSRILKKIKFNLVFHLAALTSVKESEIKPKKYFLNNYVYSKKLFKTLNLIHTEKVIYAASSSCYGNTGNKIINENHKIRPISAYARSKLKTEIFLKKYLKRKKIGFISLRLFNVYGPRSSNDMYSGVINKFIKNYLNKRKLEIYSDGKQTRSFIYISDVIRAFVILAENKIKNQIFNVGSLESFSINYLAKFFKIDKTYLPSTKGDIKFSRSGISKIYKYIKWKPKISLKKGLKLTMKSKK